jgi:hypothetical protein
MKIDAELKEMLDKLEFVQSGRAFKRWRASFMTKYESFLEQDNIDKAQLAYEKFGGSMTKFVKQVATVEKYETKGELSEEKYTVKGRMALSEMMKLMTDLIIELDDMLPSTGSMEKKRGFNKFHIGAVLIRDSFDEYGRLAACGDVLKHMREVSLEAVADKQILEEMDNYKAKLQKFCDVMADLGLYQVMMKCREFAEEEVDTLEDFLFVDLKTSGIGELSRTEVLASKALKAYTQDADGNDIFSESAVDEEPRDRIIKILLESPKLGLGFGKADNAFADEEVNVDASKIANMWGVTLKKTPKNEKGAEFIFIDQRTHAFGELSRKGCIEKELISVVKGNDGKDFLAEAEADFEERARLVEQIRELLELGVKAEKK